MVIVNFHIGRKDNFWVIVVAITHIKSTAIAIQQIVGHLVSHNLQLSAVFHSQTALTDIEASIMVIVDVQLTGTVDGKVKIIVQPNGSITVTAVARISSNCYSRIVLNCKVIVYCNAHSLVILSCNNGMIDAQLARRQTVGPIIIKIHGRILNDKMRTIRAIPGTVDHIHVRVGNRGIESTGKARTVVVGDKSGVSNIDIVSTVTAVPLQSILRIVSNGKV